MSDDRLRDEARLAAIRAAILLRLLDEARAEIERLFKINEGLCRDFNALLLDNSQIEDRARREGAEAMREAAACDVEQYGMVLEKRERVANSGHGRAVAGTTWAFSHRIRALPLPGDEPKEKK